MLYEFDSKRPAIGKDTYVSDLATVIGDVVIGDNCYIGHGVIIRGDYGRIEIRDGTAVEEGTVIHVPPNETSYIGLKVTIGHGAIIHSSRIGDLAVIGMGAVLSIRSEIGERSIIAEGGVVKQNQVIASGVVAAGNPVKILRKVAKKDEDHWAWGKQIYIDLAKKYLEKGIKPIPIK
jgi:carbonic anhydrase/acetyltransferase-like protein (isoleucine patch superfamily)